MSSHCRQNDPVLQEISKEIEKRLGTWYGSNEGITIHSLEVQKRPVSFMLSLEVSVGVESLKKLLVKIPRTGEVETIQEVQNCQDLFQVGQKEYRYLRKVADLIERCNDPALLSIRPLDYLPAWNAIVMEELPAMSLEELLLSPGTRIGVPGHRALLEKSLQRAGKWLRLYHERLGKWDVVPLSLAEMKRKYRRRFKSLQEICEKTKWLGTFAYKFEKAIQSLEGRPVPFVRSHGDYYCKNILVASKDSIVPIDFDVRSRVSAPVYLDISTLMTDIAIQKIKVRSLGFLLPQSYLFSLGGRVLEGYFEEQPYDRDILNLYNAAGAISALHWYHMRQAQWVGADRVLALLLKPYLTDYLVSLAHRHIEQVQSPLM